MLTIFILMMVNSAHQKTIDILPDCPGSTESINIPEEKLQYILITVQGPGDFDARQTTYSYHQMKQLANDPDIDLSKPTYLNAMAYLDAPYWPMSRIMGKQYKDMGYNVMHMSYIEFTATYYTRAVRNMRAVGKHAAEMLVKLMNEGLNPKTLQLVGISLGGQTIGFIADNFNRMTGIKIGKLVGLDPAGPCFRNVGPEYRLDRSNADFVLVLHSNIHGFGIVAPIGHVDFYVNGGEYQLSSITPSKSCDIFCSHVRSVLIWLASLRYPKSFIGIQCDTVMQARNRTCYDRVPIVTNTLGPDTNITRKGIFYLSTSNTYPYFMGKKGLYKKYDAFSNLAKSKTEFIKIFFTNWIINLKGV